MVHSLDNYNLKSTLIQVAAAILINWGIINGGIVLGFPSVVVPPLLGSGSGLHATISEAAWVGSINFASAPVAALLGGPLIDRVGRRWGVLLQNATLAVGWLLIAVLPLSLLALYAGRLLTGFGLGIAVCTAVTYTTEVASVSLRTVLANFTPIMLAIGTFLAYLGALMYKESWTEVSYFAFGLSVVSLVLAPLLPESPLWLLSRGRAEEALQALMRLRGASAPEQVREELDSFSSRARDKQQTGSWLSSLRDMRQPQAYKPFIFINLYFLIILFSGVPFVIAYAVDFTQSARLEAQAYYISLAMAAMRVLAALLTSWSCSRYGKRGPALVTAGVTTVTIGVLALTVYPLITLPSWLVGALVLLYVLSSSVGFSSLAWSMLGEIFPTNVRGIASGMTTFLVFIGVLILMKLYPQLTRSLGAFPIFSCFAVSALCGTVFLYFFLPETHGKTLMEIEEYFKGSRKTAHSKG